MQGHNRVININDPTAMYVPSDNKFGEANTGERYRELFRDLITSRNQLLVPIILYVDGTTSTARATLKYVPFPLQHHCSLRRCAAGITKLGDFWVMSRTCTVGDQAP
jgi:hypothetical protein